VIGAFNFSESQVLAEVYEHALDEAGFEAQVLENVGPREVIEPALEQDQIDVAVEYLGAALAFVDADAVAGPLTTGEALSLLRERLRERGIVPLEPAPGQNRNEIVVSAQTATENDLRAITDLQRIDGTLTFGGPAECPARPLCLQGLERLYQLDFGRFIALDTGGPLTTGALESGEVDVGLLFTTNPALAEGDLMALEDDRHLQPPENIVPVVRDEIASEHGEAFTDAIDEVTRLLTNEELRKLNAAIDLEHKSAHEAAREWLGEMGLL
jgi:osmoprotectant transport system substrate-binding protein